MSPTTRLRTWIPGGLLFLYCVYSLLGLASGNAALGRIYSKGALPIGSIFEPARSALGGVAEVGFVHVRHPSDTTPAEAYLFEAQYALAPVRVDAGLDHGLIVGHFARPSALERFIREHPVEVVSRLPDGVVVFRNSEIR